MEEALTDWGFPSLVGGSDKEFLECLDNQDRVCVCASMRTHVFRHCDALSRGVQNCLSGPECISCSALNRQGKVSHHLKCNASSIFPVVFFLKCYFEVIDLVRISSFSGSDLV